MLYSQRYEALRQALYNVRRQAGLTQEELAQKLGRGQSYVSKVERGEQFVDALAFIEWCEACNVSPDEVMAKI